MAIKLKIALRTSRVTLLRDALDASTAPGYLELYTATQPAAAGDAISTQVLLGTLTLSAISGTVTSGVLTFNPITDDAAADATGIIAWARFYDGAGVFVMDADCGIVASGAVLEFNNVSVQAGGLIKITSGSLTEGNA